MINIQLELSIIISLDLLMLGQFWTNIGSYN